MCKYCIHSRGGKLLVLLHLTQTYQIFDISNGYIDSPERLSMIDLKHQIINYENHICCMSHLI